MHSDIIKRYSAPVPRYTSYPTAPHFTPAIGPTQYKQWLAALAPDTKLSLYTHIPYCHTLCWYCGCNTKAIRSHKPVAAYLVPLMAEIEHVATLIPSQHEVAHIHWGGGSPNILEADDILAVAGLMRQRYHVAADAEFAVEVDPRGLTDDRAEAFAKVGVNRVSIGVQDFHPAVQAAINREQTFETTRDALELFRARGIHALNVDLVYGLPHQTTDSVAETLHQVLALKPERIAIFGYAHLPARLKHQRMIDNDALPDAMARFEQSNRLAELLIEAGFVRVGLDHFALPRDPLASKPINRNFQGYTTDAAETLIGFGASAIGRLPQGFIQNAVPVADYGRMIKEHGVAVARGIALSEDDRVRSFVIERLMCDFEFPSTELRRRFGAAASPVLKEAEILVETDADRLVERTGDGFRVTDRGRPFVRTIASRFDSYLARSQATHASGV